MDMVLGVEWLMQLGTYNTNLKNSLWSFTGKDNIINYMLLKCLLYKGMNYH